MRQEDARTRRAVLMYEGLPMSSTGAHSLGRSDPFAVWSGVSSFLDDCTAARIVDQQLRLLEAGPAAFAVISRTKRAAAGLVRRLRGEGPNDLDQAIEEATSMYGRRTREEKILGPSRESIYLNSWQLRADQVEAALEWAMHHGELPDCGLQAPPAVCISASFKLRDPSTGAVWPGQDPREYLSYDFTHGYHAYLGQSSIEVCLSRLPTMRVVLCLPFESVTPQVRDIALVLQDRLPVKLSPDHWRLWQLNRDNVGYHGRKVTVI